MNVWDKILNTCIGCFMKLAIYFIQLPQFDLFIIFPRIFNQVYMNWSWKLKTVIKENWNSILIEQMPTSRLHADRRTDRRRTENELARLEISTNEAKALLQSMWDFLRKTELRAHKELSMYESFLLEMIPHPELICKRIGKFPHQQCTCNSIGPALLRIFLSHNFNLHEITYE